MNDNNWEVNETGTRRTLDAKDLEIERLKDKIKVLEGAIRKDIAPILLEKSCPHIKRALEQGESDDQNG